MNTLSLFSHQAAQKYAEKRKKLREVLEENAKLRKKVTVMREQQLGVHS